MDRFLSAIKAKIGSIINRIRLELWFEENNRWWLKKNRPKSRFGSASEIALNDTVLKVRRKIELEEGLDYDEEMERIRHEIAEMVNKSKISSKLL